MEKEAPLLKYQNLVLNETSAICRTIIAHIIRLSIVKQYFATNAILFVNSCNYIQ